MPSYEYRTDVMTHGLLGRKEEELDRKEFEERLNTPRRRGLGVREGAHPHGAQRREGRPPPDLQARDATGGTAIPRRSTSGAASGPRSSAGSTPSTTSSRDARPVRRKAERTATSAPGQAEELGGYPRIAARSPPSSACVSDPASARRGRVAAERSGVHGLRVPGRTTPARRGGRPRRAGPALGLGRGAALREP